MKHARKAILCLGLLLFLSISKVHSEEVLELAANENAVEQAVAALLLKEIYAQVGISANIHPLPGKRANLLTLAGRKDGEVARITPYVIKNASLLRVDPAYYYLTTAVFAKKNRSIEISSKSDLKNYKVGIVSGIAHAAAAVKSVGNVRIVNNYLQLYKLIESGRVDLAIDTGINGRAVIHNLGLDDEIEIVSVIATYDLHNILHAKNAKFRPGIRKVIENMKETGKLKEMIVKYEKFIVNNWKLP